MRLSRGCYDKYHRCPGWAGGGLRYPSGPSRCDSGHIRPDYDDQWWTWKFASCDTCDVVAWPFHSRWLDPTWLWSELRRFGDRIERWRFYLSLDRKRREQIGEPLRLRAWITMAYDEWQMA